MFRKLAVISVFIGAFLDAGLATANAQTLQREYVLMNGRAVAVENIPSGTISASPNPIIVTDGSGMGSTTLTYSASGTTTTQIWINNSTQLCSGGASGTCNATGVTNGTQFQLKDAGTGLTLSTVTVVVQNITPPGAGVYDDRDSRLVYSGTWLQNSYSLLYSGTQSYSNTANSSVSFTFTGTTVSYVYGLAANLGYANIYIDGSLVQSNLDLYLSAGSAWQKIWTRTGLSSGNHTIQVVATGNKNPSATDAYVTVDAFIVGISRNDNDPAASYVGTWSSNTDPGLWNGDQHYSNTTGSYVSFSFTGSFVTFVYALNYNLGIINITIDGSSYGTLDAYNSTVAWQVSKTFSGLSSGSHTFVATVSGTKNAAATDYYITADQFVAFQ